MQRLTLCRVNRAMLGHLSTGVREIGHSWPLFHLFLVFFGQSIFTTINFPSNIWDSNPQLMERALPPITT